MADGDELRVNRNLSIPLSEIELRVSRSSGPGGQHANKTESKVEAVFDVVASQALGPGQRARILKKHGAFVRAVAQDRRSQTLNRELALERLGERLAAALHVQRSRVSTKPTTAAREKRLDTKRKRSEVKSARRKPATDD
ncbi:MAG: alternative ribosome rescue aminoacyl-tRNA hydrolase ArfB [Solirubrobacterales bacterium]